MDPVHKKMMQLQSLFTTILEVIKHQLSKKFPELDERALHIKTLEHLHKIKIPIK